MPDNARDVRLLKLAGFSTGSISIFLQFVPTVGFFFTAPQFLAFVFDYSPLLIGLGLLPIGVTNPLESRLAPKLISTFGRGPVGGAGLGILAAGAAMFSVVGVGSFLTAGYRSSVESSDALPAELVEPISGSAGAGLAIAGQTAASGDQQLAGSIIDTVSLGIANGFGQAMLVAAGVAVVGAIYVAIRTPKTTGPEGHRAQRERRHRP